MKSIYSYIKFVAKIYIGFVKKPIDSYLKSEYHRMLTKYARFYKNLTVKKDTVLYESYAGRSITCNPYALFCEMLKDKKYSNFTHIWVVDSFENHKITIDEYKEYKNVIFVEHKSEEYIKWLASAEYLISNVTFYPFFTKKENQIYINTWHGIPLKNLGYDMPEGAKANLNVARNFLQADYCLSPNTFFTKILKGSAYKLENIYTGKIIEAGYPRYDLLYSNKETVLNKCKTYGLEINPKKKIILYAPTWRGANFAKPQDNFDEIVEFKTNLENIIDCDKYQVLVKPHHVLYNILDKSSVPNYIVPTYVDPNEILSVTDILISDFSSIFYDYLSLNRPVLFYIPDFEEYKQERGLYSSLDTLPAPYTDNVQQIADWVDNIDNFAEENRSQYNVCRKFCENLDEKNISKQILDIIFDKKASNKIIECEKTKERIFFCVGHPMVNGITSSLCNLLQNICYETYDVTLYTEVPKGAAEEKLLSSLPKNVRILFRSGNFNRTLLEQIQSNYSELYLFINKISKWIYNEAIYKREARRIVGNAEFDHVINFDGYTRYQGLLCLYLKAKKRYMWLHNDMVNEKKVKYFWLKYVFSLYQCYDSLVACSSATMEINKSKLHYLNQDHKFTYATNIINIEKAENFTKGANYITLKEKEYFVDTKENIQRLIPLSFEQLNDFSGKHCIVKSVWKNNILDLNILDKVEKNIKFITIGRCSVEKNHINLIKAFINFNKKFPNSMLYIVGHGKDFNKEYNFIIKNSMQNNIIMTGNLVNPFGLMQKCDCFILPSLHEGYPVVVLEARVLKMPIIMSNFETHEAALFKNEQLLIGTSIDEIYEGFISYIEGKVPTCHTFNAHDHNRKCIKEFYDILQK